MQTQASGRVEHFIELAVELPLLSVAPQQFAEEKLEDAREMARKIRSAYPKAKIKLHWVKRTVVGNMKDVAADALVGDNFVKVPKDRVAAPFRGRDVRAQEPNAVNLDRPARGSWAR